MGGHGTICNSVTDRVIVDMIRKHRLSGVSAQQLN